LTDAEVIETYRATIRPLYAYVSRRLGGNQPLAEDLVQETWMRALDTWPRRGVPDEPLGWLITVARNAIASHFRRVRPQVDVTTIDLEAPAFAPEAPDAASVIGWGLARLRRGHAELLEAFYFDGKSVRQIAADRATSERAIEGRLRRARAALKKKLTRLVRPTAAPGGDHVKDTIKERTIHVRPTRTS
jgi:RNA polymerase sigma-70 factor (ECF subfamily)